MARRSILPLTFLLLTSTAEAAPEKPSAAKPAKAAKAAKAAKTAVTKDGVLLLIWGGGKKPEDATKAIEQFTRSRIESSAAPVKLDSTKVKGLNPGFHIAVLGACPAGQGRAILQRLRVVSDGVYARWIPREGEVKALACPKVKLPRGAWFYEPEGDGETHHLKDRVSVKSGAATLAAELDVALASNGETMSADYRVELSLVGPKGDVLGTETIAPRATFARVERFEAEGSELHLEADEASSDCGRDTFFEIESVTYTVRAKAGQIDVVRAVTSKESGLCEPSPEGLSGCELGRKMARFQALQAACKDATREACTEASAAYVDESESCDEEPAHD